MSHQGSRALHVWTRQTPIRHHISADTQVGASAYSLRQQYTPDTPVNSRVGGSALLEVVPDAERLFHLPAGFVPLRETRLTGRIEGPLAALVLTQVFAYRRDACDRVLEARYRFPLPGDAAVTGVTARFGDVLVDTMIVPRSEAHAAYARARLEGRQAALTTRESPDVFTLQLAGLQPDQEVCIQTTFTVAAAADGPGWQLRLPLTIGPRYSRPDELGTPAAQGQPLALDAAPDGGCRVHLADGAVLPNRDFVLTWRPPRPLHRPALDVLVHEDLEAPQLSCCGQAL